MRFALALSVSLITGTASANSMAIPPAQHGIFDSGKLPPSAQGIMTFGEAGSISLKSAPIGGVMGDSESAKTKSHLHLVSQTLQ